MLSYMPAGIRAVSTEHMHVVNLYMYCQGALRLPTTDIGLSLTCLNDISNNIRLYICVVGKRLVLCTSEIITLSCRIVSRCSTCCVFLI